MKRRGIPAEALMELRQRLNQLPPRSESRRLLVQETAQLYGVSKGTLYRALREQTRHGRARFVAHHSRGLAEPPDQEYPFVLTTGRLYGHWHTQTRTGRIEKIRQMHPQPFIEIHPRDAANLGIQDNDWLEVRSRRGASRFPANITKAIAPGSVFVPMHWGFLWAEQAQANALTHSESCPDSRQPELKACAVQLVPVAAVSISSDDLNEPTQSQA